MIFAATLLLTGCDLLDEAREELDNLTNPLVGQVLVVGIDEPDDANVAAALEGTDWDMGVFAQVFLADASFCKATHVSLKTCKRFSATRPGVTQG